MHSFFTVGAALTVRTIHRDLDLVRVLAVGPEGALVRYAMDDAARTVRFSEVLTARRVRS
jgi:hypothetical protein